MSLEKIRYIYDKDVKRFEEWKGYDMHPLHRAAEDNRVELIEIYVEQYGCDIDIVNCHNHTALAIAIREHQLDAAKKLVELGTDQTLCRISDPVMTSIIEGDRTSDLLEFILYHQLIDIRKYIARKPIKFDNIRCPEILIILAAMGYNYNNTLYYMTPLMVVASSHSLCHRFELAIEKVKVLLAAGASASIVTPSGKTVFDFVNHLYEFDGRPDRGPHHVPIQIPKEELVNLLTNGVSEEYQEAFENKITSIRCRISKQNITLFEALMRQLVL